LPELWASPSLLGELEQQVVLQRPELLLRARLVRVALREQLARSQVLRRQAMEFLFRRPAHEQPAQLQEEQHEPEARQSALLLRQVARLQRVRAEPLSQLHPSRLFLKSRRLLRQLRLALVAESAF
jgi:hypothetical protein